LIKKEQIPNINTPINRFFLSKVLPGKVDCQYVANSHSVDLPIKHSRGTYTVNFDGSQSFMLFLYSPTSVANNPSRWSGFSSSTVLTSTTVNTSFLTSAGNGALTNPQFYSGDFNLFSQSGFIYAGKLYFRFYAPAATFAM